MFNSCNAQIDNESFISEKDEINKYANDRSYRSFS